MNFWRRLILRLLRVNVTYTDNADVLKSQPCIVVSNHQSLLDGIVFALAAPVSMDYAVTPKHAVKNIFTSRVLGFLQWCGLGRVVPLSANKVFAIRGLSKSLILGRSVMIFPTGKITPGEDQRGYVWLSEKTKCRIVRASISGADNSILFSHSGNKLWPRIELVI
ncbi:lysophospholipid acyltransferase family protein [uncultured Tateyamaria sp.]|uniref:lysophospholipid acyltransferase family protein n=1 Tax=uncultured Tateyamaria sp. TaxID=455651 RepID=UPI0026335C2B|nr:lysophospholipid acyltransferase family protein [uncultured Tateyamaria sp.]